MPLCVEILQEEEHRRRLEVWLFLGMARRPYGCWRVPA